MSRRKKEFIEFMSFGKKTLGVILAKWTDDAEYVVVVSKNPYGSQNLVLVEINGSENIAIIHGNIQVTQHCYSNAPVGIYKKVKRWMASRGKLYQVETEIERNG